MPVGECHLSDRDFGIAFRSRFRIALPDLHVLATVSCTCRPQGRDHKFDPHGDHLLTCKFVRGKERTLLHDKINTFLASLNSAARIPTITDPKNNYVAQDNKIQPDGSVITVRRYLDLYSGDGHLFADGRDSLSDVTGVHGITLPMYLHDFQPAHIRDGIKARTAQKNAKYADVVSQLGFNFRPLAFEIDGGA